MTVRHIGRQRVLAVVLAAVVAALLGACGGTASVAPSGTPGPTPTPVNVERAFLAAVTDAGFKASGTLSGSATIGAAEATIEGTFRGTAEAFEQVWNLSAGAVVLTTNRIATAADGWERFGAGPWLALPAPAEPAGPRSLFAWLASLTELESAGSESRGGTTVTHFKTPADSAAIPPEVVGFDAAEVTSPAIVIDLYASNATGAPVAADVSATWSQAVLGVATAASYTLSYAFTDIGTDVTIETPTDVWTLAANPSLGYQIAMPAGWTVAADGDRDVFSREGVPTVIVRANGNATGLTLDEFRSAITATYHADFGEPQSVTASTLGGVPANFLRYGLRAGSSSAHALLDRIAMHRAGWEVSMITPAAPTAADEELFELFCASFAFTK